MRFTNSPIDTARHILSWHYCVDLSPSVVGVSRLRDHVPVYRAGFVAPLPGLRPLHQWPLNCLAEFTRLAGQFLTIILSLYSIGYDPWLFGSKNQCRF